MSVCSCKCSYCGEKIIIDIIGFFCFSCDIWLDFELLNKCKDCKNNDT